MMTPVPIAARLGAIAVVLALVTAACGANEVESAGTSTEETIADSEASTTTAAPEPAAAPTTTAPPATMAPPTTTDAIETRPEILRLALPTFGGGTFDPNTVAGKNVLLWFWGAH